MSIKAKLCSLSMTAVVFAFTASVGIAADTVCSPLIYGPDADPSVTIPDTIIAVASNFYTPSQDMVAAFQQTTDGRPTIIQICQNSTTHLMAEISDGTGLPAPLLPDPGYPRYSMFFAANTSAANYGTSAYSYAKGIPVFFGLQSKIASVSNLVTGLGGGYSATITAAVTDLGPYAVNTGGSQPVAVASAAAPYGVAAHTILNGIEGTLLPGTIPSWVYPTLFSNIDLTYAAIEAGTNGIKSGFVSKAQICDQIKGITTPAVTFVEFTGTGCTLDQKAILLKPSGDSVAAALNSYIRGQMPPNSGWNTFLTAHCYGTL